jgi:dTDP-4-amino-4,6-dideoxygalactose transaminase
MKTKIPFVDLLANYKSIKSEIDNCILEVINQQAFIGGANNPFVSKFEDEFKNYLGANYAVSCANGTDAIEIALQSIGIKKGDQILVPALSWVSTAEAVVNIGADPIFIDINIDDNTINNELIESKINSKTKAIIAVHLYGAPANVEAIRKICDSYKLFFIEDCAQAHGSEFKNKKVGTFGDVSIFSFYPGKNLGSFGDAGMMIFKDEQNATIAKQIANHGQLSKHIHKRIGRNSRLDGIQAAILSVKLKYLDEWNNSRLENASYYNYLLNEKYEKPKIESHLKNVFHLYVIKTKDRDKVIKILNEHQIGNAIHYPKAMSSMDIFKNKTHCPVAENTCSLIISLPMYPELKKEDIEYVANVLNKIDN